MLKIVYRKISDLRPNPKNPRKAVQNGVIELAESIKANPKFFEARPILLSNRTGELVIIGGERRWEAAKYADQKEAPTILFEGLTEEEEDEIMNKDNTHWGVWDEQKLQQWDKSKLESWKVPVNWGGASTNINVDGALPAELQGVDITPEKLEKFEQTGKTKADRILITFLPEDADELAAMLGLEKLEKVLYRFEELKK